MGARTALNILGLIPARAGSKRILGKNIKLCAGKPLLLYTCEAAIQSRYLSRIVVSTDDMAIKDIAESIGIDVPFLRPDEISGDDVPMIEVVRHAYQRLTSQDAPINCIVLLQPTSPLREARHIDESIERFLAGGVDSVVSVVRTPHIYHPSKLFFQRNNLLFPFGELSRGTSSRYSNDVFARNGPAVLVLDPKVLVTNSLYGDKSAPYEMRQEASIDIDTPFDFALAEFLLTKRKLCEL